MAERPPSTTLSEDRTSTEPALLVLMLQLLPSSVAVAIAATPPPLPRPLSLAFEKRMLGFIAPEEMVLVAARLALPPRKPSDESTPGAPRALFEPLLISAEI
jgi:hypothetical protein